ncbi:MAG: exonuclease SbcCD subunit D [Lachnospiraceae bacterium]|nr:exonuclease SbcCD subunit D [Lachnospiraceae bacterium]
MKFLHTSDLHIGKTVNEFSMLEDQRYILRQICDIAEAEKVDAVVIAGDVYDRAIPAAEAVKLLDDFLTDLLARKIPVIMISGNHDCPERVAFADRILEKQGLYIAGGYTQEPKRVVLEDAFGPVDFVCLPFVKPAVAGGRTSAEAVESILGSTPMTLDLRTRHVLVTHFFVTGEGGRMPELSDSETTVHVGGLDNVPVSLFGMFDYVALGHIHKPQQIGEGPVYYAGSPLKYSFSEAKGNKYANLVTLGPKGQVQVEKRQLRPLHEMRVLRGTLEELMQQGMETTVQDREDYIQAVLTDQVELLDPIGALRSVYPNVMQIVLEKNLKDPGQTLQNPILTGRKSIEELFGDFYEMLKGEKMDEKRLEIVTQTAKEAQG